MKKPFLLIFSFLFFLGCQNTKTLQSEVQTWLDNYNSEFQSLLKTSAEAEWKLNTYILEGDTVSSKKAEEANEAFAKFTGSSENIEKAKKYLSQKDKLSPLQVKQLETILYMAGGNPEIAGDIVKEKIKAQTEQTKNLFGFDFQLNGKSVSTNDLDEVLRESVDLNERLKAWESSKEVGKGLKPGLIRLQELRNKSVQPLGYSDFFNYQVSEYGMTTAEMMKVCKDMIDDVWPVYRELHTWARYTLAEKYKQPVPDMLPAHWLPNRWGQEWSSLVKVEGINLDEVLKPKGAEYIVKEGENFYKSLGFPALPETFYAKSSLYPLPPDAPYKKNNHASAWHMDNDKDVRSLMSIVPNTEWWGTTLHELGHIYYYMTYSNKDVPIILRGGANRGFHEAMGSLMGLASLQTPFLEAYGLIPKGTRPDPTLSLLKEALEYVVLIPWGAGVMTEFEHDLYAKNLPANKYNQRWWELVAKYQGINPPNKRGEEFCDAASKTHINDDAAQYYDYSISNVLLFQFHQHIATKILKQHPHATNYLGSKETGDFLRSLMYPGASIDWRESLQKSLGEGMSAKAMTDYFSPLTAWLKEQNKGRKYTLPQKLS